MAKINYEKKYYKERNELLQRLSDIILDTVYDL